MRSLHLGCRERRVRQSGATPWARRTGTGRLLIREQHGPVVYRSRMDGTSDSLAGVVAATQHLPASQGAELQHTAREAFTASLYVTATGHRADRR